MASPRFAILLAASLGLSLTGCATTEDEPTTDLGIENGKTDVSGTDLLKSPWLMQNIDLATGEIDPTSRAAEIALDSNWHVTTGSGLSSGLRNKLNSEADSGFEFMRQQGSDSFSTSISVFSIADTEQKRVGFGVWAGAPGDIGGARLVSLDNSGKRIAVVTEEAYQKAIDNEVSPGIALDTGRLGPGTTKLAVDFDGLQVADSSMNTRTRQALSRAVKDGWQRMLDQGTDSFSISIVAFKKRRVGAVTGYGVWVGAPGDIGAAGLATFDRFGHLVDVMIEQ